MIKITLWCECGEHMMIKMALKYDCGGTDDD